MGIEKDLCGSEPLLAGWSPSGDWVVSSPKVKAYRSCLCRHFSSSRDEVPKRRSLQLLESKRAWNGHCGCHHHRQTEEVEFMNRSFWSTLKKRWCKVFHGAPMWPIHGYYRCATCLCEHPVPWGSREGVPYGRSVMPKGAPDAEMGPIGLGRPQVAYAVSRSQNPL
jgi:hypothetical protein